MRFYILLLLFPFILVGANSQDMTMDVHCGQSVVALALLQESLPSTTSFLSRPNGDCAYTSKNVMFTLNETCGFIQRGLRIVGVVDVSPLPSTIFPQYNVPFIVSCPLVAYAGGTAIKKTARIQITIEDSSGKIQNDLIENHDYTIRIQSSSDLLPVQCIIFSGESEVFMEEVRKGPCSHEHITGGSETTISFNPSQLNNLTEAVLQCQFTSCTGDECNVNPCENPSSLAPASYMIIAKKISIYKKEQFEALFAVSGAQCLNESGIGPWIVSSLLLAIASIIVWSNAIRICPREVKEQMLRFRVRPSATHYADFGYRNHENQISTVESQTSSDGAEVNLKEDLGTRNLSVNRTSSSPASAVVEYLSVDELLRNEPEPESFSSLPTVSETVMESLPDPPMVTIQELCYLQEQFSNSRHHEKSYKQSQSPPRKPLQEPPLPPEYSKPQKEQPLEISTSQQATKLNQRVSIASDTETSSYSSKTSPTSSKRETARLSYDIPYQSVLPISKTTNEPSQYMGPSSDDDVFSIRSRPLPPIPLPRVHSAKDLTLPISHGRFEMHQPFGRTPSITIESEAEFTSETLDKPAGTVVAALLRDNFLRFEHARPVLVLQNGDMASQF